MPVVYVACMAAAAALAFAKMALLAGLLGDEVFASYAFLSACVSYAVPIVGVGIVDGMARRLAFYEGAGSRGLAAKMRGACLGALVIVSVVLVVLSPFVIYWASRGARLTTVEVSLGIAQVGAFLFYFYVLRDLRSRFRMSVFSGLLLSRAVLDVVVAVPAGIKLGVPGIFGAEVVILVALTLWGWVFVLDGVGPRFDAFADVVDAVKDGLLILVGGVAGNTALMADRLILGGFLPKREFAVYASNALMVTVALTVANMVFQYAYPRIQSAYGRHLDPQKTLVEVGSLASRLAYACVALCLLGVVAVPIVVRLVPPSFDLDAVLLSMFAVGGMIEVCNLFPVMLIAVGAFREFLIVQLIAGVVTALALILLSVYGVSSLPVFASVFVCGRILVLVAAGFLAARHVRAWRVRVGVKM